jgi:hypothetical protein
MNRSAAHSASKYHWFAEQCIERAQSAKSPQEALGYLERAAVWHRLAEGRKDTGGAQNHFVGQRRKPDIPTG